MTSEYGAARELLLAIARSAIDAVRPRVCLPPAVVSSWDGPPAGRTIVLGAGKAAAHMAAAFESCYLWPCEGLVVTRHGFGVATAGIEVVEAGHPVPDAAGLESTRRVVEIARSATAVDRVVFLLSGGASALLVSPANGISLSEKQEVTRRLLGSGAPVQEMNTVRSAMSQVKAGGLAACCAVPMHTFAISDVVGDDAQAIGSAPTLPPPPDLVRRALDILAAYGITAPRGLSPLVRENVGQRDGSTYRIVASAADLIAAAGAEIVTAGLRPVILSDRQEGIAADVAGDHAAIISAGRAPGCVFLSGGELTVRIDDVAGSGRGGPNQEYVLALACRIDPALRYVALALDTDGVDGSEDKAGAIVDANTLERAAGLGLDAERSLSRHDSHGFFEPLDDLIETGPTGTNVNDLRMVLTL